MSTLNDDFSEIYQQFVAGNFATQLSSAGKFSRSETGQVIEMTLNRDTNTPGDSQQGQAKLCHHPPPPTTSQNISTTTHYHPPPAKIYHHYPLSLTTIHQHPPTAKIYLPLPITSQKNDHHPTKAKINLFITSF